MAGSGDDALSHFLLNDDVNGFDVRGEAEEAGENG